MPVNQPSPVDLLPDSSSGTPYRIGVVCLGNICRSPIGEVVLTAKLREAGLDDLVEVVSAGTGDWHVGNPMDRRAAAALTAHGYDASQHRAQQFQSGWFDDCDLVLAMDSSNHHDLNELARRSGADPERIRLFREFDPRAADHDRDVPDPYYGADDGFTVVLAMVERTADRLVQALVEHLQAKSED